MWVNMNNEWYEVKVVDPQTIWATLIMLFTSSLFPYATDIVSENFDNKVAQIFYGIVVLLITFANLLMYYCVRKANPGNQKVAYKLHQHLSWMTWDIIVKLLGLVLSANIFAPAMTWSVLLTLIILVIPNQFRAVKQEKE